MADVEYKPNSHKYKAEQAAKQKEQSEKKVEKVVSGTAKTKKKSEMSKFKDIFISEDASNVKSYVVMDVLIPAMKKAVSDIVTNGIDMILYGETGGSRRRSPSERVSYRNYYDRRDDRPIDRGRTRTGYSYDDIIVPSRGEAEEVLSRMDELIDQYGVVSVGDLYDLVGITGNYTDQKYGWTNIRTAEPQRVRDGYMLKLPKALPID
jgi:hypothetical protein